MKDIVKDSNWIHPMPNTIVSCRTEDGQDNALAIQFIANVATEPLKILVAVRPERFSNKAIRESKSFVVNLPGKDYSKEFAYLGSVSGFDEKKLEDMNTIDADEINAPILVDCPINYECKLYDTFSSGTHDLFVGEVVKVHCNEDLIKEDGSIDWQKADLL